MPRVLGQRDCSSFQRGVIIGLHQEGLNYTEIGRRVGLSVSRMFITTYDMLKPFVITIMYCIHDMLL